VHAVEGVEQAGEADAAARRLGLAGAARRRTARHRRRVRILEQDEGALRHRQHGALERAVVEAGEIDGVDGHASARGRRRGERALARSGRAVEQAAAVVRHTQAAILVSRGEKHLAIAHEPLLFPARQDDRVEAARHVAGHTLPVAVVEDVERRHRRALALMRRDDLRHQAG
jgi:hypothetical protein